MQEARDLETSLVKRSRRLRRRVSGEVDQTCRALQSITASIESQMVYFIKENTYSH